MGEPLSLYQFSVSTCHLPEPQCYGPFKIPDGWAVLFPKNVCLEALAPEVAAQYRDRACYLTAQAAAALVAADDGSWSEWGGGETRKALLESVSILYQKVSMFKGIWTMASKRAEDPSVLFESTQRLLNATEKAHEECLRKGLADDKSLRQLVDRTAAKLFAFTLLVCPRASSSCYTGMQYSISDWPSYVKEIFSSELAYVTLFHNPSRPESALKQIKCLWTVNSEQRAKEFAIAANAHQTAKSMDGHLSRALQADADLKKFQKPLWLTFDALSEMPKRYPLSFGAATYRGNQCAQEDRMSFHEVVVNLGPKTILCPLFFLADGHGPKVDYLNCFCLNVQSMAGLHLAIRRNDSHDAIYRALTMAFLDIEEQSNPEDSGFSLALGLIFNEHLYVFGWGNVRPMFVFRDGRIVQLFPVETDSQASYEGLHRKIFPRGMQVINPLGPSSSSSSSIAESVVPERVFSYGMASLPKMQVIPMEYAKGGILQFTSRGVDAAQPDLLGSYTYLKRNEPNLHEVAENMVTIGYQYAIRDARKQKQPLVAKNASVLLARIPQDREERADEARGDFF